MDTNEIQDAIAKLCLTRPRDGRFVTLKENRGGWKYTGLSGVCKCLSEDGTRMVLIVENDPEKGWPVGSDVLVELDDETAADFEVYS